MRQTIAAVLLATAAATNSAPAMAVTTSLNVPSGNLNANPTAKPFVPGFQPQGPPQTFPGQGTFPGQVSTQPFPIQGGQGALPPRASTTGVANGKVPSVAPQVKGIPIGTDQGVTDSDWACAAGLVAACGLPNVPNVYNPNPNMRYQTQQSDQLLWQLFQTGNYAANGQRVDNGRSGNVDIPYYTTGNYGGANWGAVYSVNPYDPSRRPQDAMLNYVTNNPLAPNGRTPSASNAVLPGSAAYQWANLNPQWTTPVNQVTSAGYGYSTKLNTPGVSPVPNYGYAGNGYLGGAYLGNVGQNFGYQGFQGLGANYGGYLGGAYLGGGYLGGAGLGNYYGQGLAVGTPLAPGVTYAQRTNNYVPTNANGLASVAWSPSTGFGGAAGSFFGTSAGNVPPQAGGYPGGFYPHP